MPYSTKEKVDELCMETNLDGTNGLRLLGGDRATSFRSRGMRDDGRWTLLNDMNRNIEVPCEREDLCAKGAEFNLGGFRFIRY